MGSRLFMDTIEKKKQEAIEILSAVGIPIEKETSRRKERFALALLAVANLKPNDSWSNASIYEDQDSWSLATREIISFWNNHYGEKISSGSYDDVRRKDLIVLVESRLVLRSAGNPNASTNNPTRRYGIEPDAIDVLRSFGTPEWKHAVKHFVATFGSLEDRMEPKRNFNRVPVHLPGGDDLCLTPGPHNELQKAIVEEFLPRFAPGSEVLYLGDTSNKYLFLDEARLRDLGFFELAHDALPDVVAYDKKRNWIFLVEAVHSANPISHLRHMTLERMAKNCAAPRVYVSAFKDRKIFREWVEKISWETEVWLADSPDHMIHFNGDKFLGPP